MRHNFEAHSNVPGFNFTCGTDGCPQTFVTHSGIMSHLRRKHRCVDMDRSHISPSNQDDNLANPVVGETCYIPDVSTNDTNDGSASSPHHIQLDRLERSAALFLLSMKEKYQITQTALDFAVGQVQQMVTFAVEDIQSAVETRLRSHHTENISEMPDISDCFKIPQPFGSLQNEYMQTKYYRENFDLIVSLYYFWLYACAI